MAQLKSTNITGNLVVTGNTLASKIIKLGGTNTQILLANGDVLDVPAAGLGTVTQVELKPLDGIVIEGDPITDAGYISIGHANTSDVTNLTGTNRTYVKSLKFDQFGHVTEYTTGTETVTNTDTKVTQSNTDTGNWRKIVLSKQSDATMGTATTETTDVVYVTPNIEAQSSTGSLRMTGNMLLHNPDGGDSPKLVFQRGDEKGSVTDWNMYVQSGVLKINSVPTSNSTTERNIADFAYNGGMTIYSCSDTANTETASMTVKTSNGGQLIIGKEGPNSGTMLRFDQEAGKTRLRFRASSTAGAMVWEQPEKAARLYLDFGNAAGNGTNRVNVPNPEGGGTLALLSDIKSGTVTSVGITVPTGLSVSPATITSSGTFAIKYATGYAIPTTAKQTNWDTAYGWGDHSKAGYLKSFTEADTLQSVTDRGAITTHAITALSYTINSKSTIQYNTTEGCLEFVFAS